MASGPFMTLGLTATPCSGDNSVKNISSYSSQLLGIPPGRDRAEGNPAAEFPVLGSDPCAPVHHPQRAPLRPTLVKL